MDMNIISTLVRAQRKLEPNQPPVSATDAVKPYREPSITFDVHDRGNTDKFVAISSIKISVIFL